MKVVFSGQADSPGDMPRQAIAGLVRSGVPVVPCAGLTGLEMQTLRTRLGLLDQPFLVEAGAALSVPKGYFPFSTGFRHHDGLEVATYGETKAELRPALNQAAAESGCKVAVVEDARLFALAFRINAGDPKRLLTAIEKGGRLWKRAGGEYSITGDHDRRQAIMVLTRFFFQISRNVLSIGLGESLADLDLLSAVDRPVVVRSRDSEEIRRVLPSVVVTHHEEAEGWTEALRTASQIDDQRNYVA